MGELQADQPGQPQPSFVEGGLPKFIYAHLKTKQGLQPVELAQLAEQEDQTAVPNDLEYLELQWSQGDTIRISADLLRETEGSYAALMQYWIAGIRETDGQGNEISFRQLLERHFDLKQVQGVKGQFVAEAKGQEARDMVEELQEIITNPEGEEGLAAEKEALIQHLRKAGFPDGEIQSAFRELGQTDLSYDADRTTLAAGEPFDPRKFWTSNGKNLGQVKGRLRQLEEFIRSKYYDHMERAFDRLYERGLDSATDEAARDALWEELETLMGVEAARELHRILDHHTKLRDLERGVLDELGDVEFRTSPETGKDNFRIFPADIDKLFPQLRDLRVNKPDTDTPFFPEEVRETMRDLLHTLPTAIPLGLAGAIIIWIILRSRSGSGRRRHPA